MNITKENFNQYVAIAIDLAAAELYEESSKIAFNAFNAWASWASEEESEEALTELHSSEAVRILTYSQWREAERLEDYAMRAEILNHNNYWSDEFIGNLNDTYTAAWILREKAVAYRMLAMNWATDQLYDIYMDYGQSYMLTAIDIYEEIAASENDADVAEICTDCKIDLAIIRRGISNRLARMTAIQLFSQNLTDEQKERVMDVYQQSTDVIFDDYFSKKGIAVVQHSEAEDDNVKEDVINYLLERYSEPCNDDLYWWTFTHKNTPDERKKIRFVEQIEDAADNDFDNIPWVFTLDRYPFDIEFDDNQEPSVGVYEIDSQDTGKYHKI